MAQVGKDKVVTINYTLTNDAGETLDSSEGRPPLMYLHGVGQLVPGVEHGLEGHQPGDSVQVVVPPDQGYGQRDQQLVVNVPRSQFVGISDIQPGMQFEARTNAGPRLVRVTDVEGDRVTIDANHPLAGQTLHFDVNVVDVRDATAEEMQHGHAHGLGGHQNN